MYTYIYTNTRLNGFKVLMIHVSFLIPIYMSLPYTCIHIYVYIYIYTNTRLNSFKVIMIYTWVVHQTRMSHVTKIHTSRHTHWWVRSHVFMSQVPHINGSWHTSECYTIMQKQSAPPINTNLRKLSHKTPHQIRTATHCNNIYSTLQHTATQDCNTLQQYLQHTATHCNTLQHTATTCTPQCANIKACSTPQQRQPSILLQCAAVNPMRTATHYNDSSTTTTHAAPYLVWLVENVTYRRMKGTPWTLH